MVNCKSATFFSLLIVILSWNEIVCAEDRTGRSDFVYGNKSLTRIAFGSCMNGMFNGSKWYQKPQPVWKHILEQHPDLWIWLGDAAYGDTRLLPFLWTASPLPLMANYFRRQKNHPDYQEFLKSNTSIVGIWDDHDYGMNDGGKNFRNRLQTQNIFLDFLDEPLDSMRRRREGMYVSYTFGHGDTAIKLIMLDIRSFAVYGSKCDLLGSDQWRWLESQLDDQTPVALTIVTSGIQILPNSIKGLQSWDDCPPSYDRLIWLTQSRNKVIYLSGDVHFGETSCLNSSSSGYPLYELTSSGLYMACTIPLFNFEQCVWSIRNAVGNDFRITDPVVERNFGLVEIDWSSNPTTVKLQIFGQKGSIVSEVVINLDHITKKVNAAKCPDIKRPEASLAKIYLYWAVLGLIIILAILVVLASTIFILYKLFVSLRYLGKCLWKSNHNSKPKQKRS